MTILFPVRRLQILQAIILRIPKCRHRIASFRDFRLEIHPMHLRIADKYNLGLCLICQFDQVQTFLEIALI